MQHDAEGARRCRAARLAGAARFFFCASTTLLLLVSACGKVGDPQPPFIRIPEAVKDLAVTQRGYDLVLTWTNPPRYVDGSAATNLAHIRILGNAGSIATVNAAGAGQVQSHAIPVGSVVAGERKFSVIAETTQGKLSQVSNSASITPVDVPGRVTRLTAVPDQRRIFLKWEKPRDHAELADAYVVVRADNPAEAETVTDMGYEDVRYQVGKIFTYQITAARRVAGTMVMGVGPESVTITAEDKTPPMAPVGLGITTSDTGAYLTWDPNAETDLAGYHVFRSERPDAGFEAVGDHIIGTTLFFDPSYRPGLYYALTAVDESGNESAMSAPFRGP